MNIKEYIESGIIESYVMDLASESEKAEFERNCAQYPELVAARRKFEENLEEYAARNAAFPPPEVKVKVLEAIGGSGPRMTTSSNPPKINAMQNEKIPVRSLGLMRLIAAASVILFLVMGWLYFQAKQQNSTLVNANNDLTNTNGRLKEKLDTTQNILDKIVKEQSESVGDPNATVVNMVGTKVAPKSSANIYWDSTSSSVYLVVRNMPKLPSDQQYQLWALIDGKPNDLGVFDGSGTDRNVILKMKNTKKAQAFAITIEKQGGSPSPTLEKMQSLGKATQTQ